MSKQWHGRGGRRRVGQGWRGLTPEDIEYEPAFEQPNTFEDRPLPNDLPFLGIIIARFSFPNDLCLKPRVHPMLVWGRYYDDEGQLRAIDCFPLERVPKRIYPDFFFLPPEECHRLGAVHGTGIKTNKCYYIRNTAANVVRVTGAQLDEKFVPDIIIRRTQSMLYAKFSDQDAGCFQPLDGFTRQGLTFPNVKIEDLINDTFSPEVADAPLKKQRQDLPYLSLTDIKAICAIARNYVAFCKHHKVDIVYPPAGTWLYPQWPSTFMNFEQGANARSPFHRYGWDGLPLPTSCTPSEQNALLGSRPAVPQGPAA